MKVSTGWTCDVIEPVMNPMKIGQLSAQLMNSAPVVMLLATTLPSMRLPSPATIAASSGRKTMAVIMFW